ncbi:hypothetical protein ACRAWD_01065 [Caulobacter segnis]
MPRIGALDVSDTPDTESARGDRTAAAGEALFGAGNPQRRLPRSGLPPAQVRGA